MDDHNGWLTVRPKLQGYWRENRFDRHVLGPVLRGAPNLTLSQEADAALRLPPDEDNPAPTFLIHAASGESLPDLLMQRDWLRLYGSLDDRHKALAESRPPGLRYGDLSETQQAMFAQLVFGLDNGLRFKQSHQPALMREPTEALPNGIPASAVVQISEQTEACVFPDDPNNSDSMRSTALSASQLAMNLFMRDHPDVIPGTPGPAAQAAYSHFCLGTVRTVMLALQLTPDDSVLGNLHETLRTSGDSIAFADLPAEFKSSVQSQLASYNKNIEVWRAAYRASGAGQGGASP